jgi:hypothetical protein
MIFGWPTFKIMCNTPIFYQLSMSNWKPGDPLVLAIITKLWMQQLDFNQPWITAKLQQIIGLRVFQEKYKIFKYSNILKSNCSRSVLLSETTEQFESKFGWNVTWLVLYNVKKIYVLCWLKILDGNHHRT